MHRASQKKDRIKYQLKGAFYESIWLVSESPRHAGIGPIVMIVLKIDPSVGQRLATMGVKNPNPNAGREVFREPILGTPFRLAPLHSWTQGTAPRELPLGNQGADTPLSSTWHSRHAVSLPCCRRLHHKDE